MKRCFFAFALVFSFLVPSANAAMVRVVEVVDALTIIVDDNGRQSTVTLAGVDLTAGEEDLAAGYLRQLVAGKWVLVEAGGFVYRSPDGLCVNNAMARHPWLGSRFTYLGTVAPGSARKIATTTTKQSANAPVPQPTQVQVHRRPHKAAPASSAAPVSSSPAPASNAAKGTTPWHAEATASPSAPPP